MRSRALVVALAVVACLGLAACSDDDDGGESGGGGGRLTSTQLAQRGDAVCRALDAEVKDLAETFEDTIIFTGAQMLELYTKMVPLVDKAITSFKGLQPPSDLATRYQEALTQLETDRQSLVAATADEQAARRLYDGGTDPFTASNEKLAVAGITACANSGGGGDQASGDTTDSTEAGGGTTETSGETTTTTGG
ncbi:MAG: hypothetical protein ACRD0S_12620 [Acidimicrobiales bacterium]